ncbi:MAG: pentapeptide repeat-containing protein [Isosphaeraceae bacterium]
MRRSEIPLVAMCAVFFVFLLLAVFWGYGSPQSSFGAWTGLGEFSRPMTFGQEYQRYKTLWDWLGLLVIPAVLVVGGYWLTLRQESLTREIEDRRHDRFCQEALQTYIDSIVELIFEKDLLDSSKDSAVRKVARVRTLTVLRVLDGARKGALLKFLHESKLISKDLAIIELMGADLREADLYDADLREADLREARLGKASLQKACLGGADLRGASLVEARLAWADLHAADLREAELFDANLNWADLQRADLHEANLVRAEVRYANLSGANLGQAKLSRSQ